MSGRSLRPRDTEDPKPMSKGKGKASAVVKERKVSRKRTEPLCENEADIDPWVGNGD